MNATQKSSTRIHMVRTQAFRGMGLATAAAGVLASLALAGPAGDEKPGNGSQRLVLFDGKTLTGWEKTDFVHTGDVKVEDGSIILSAGRSLTGITSTRKDLFKANYELTYEAKRLTGEDFFAAATFPVGKSYITFVNGGWSGNVTGLSSLNGSDASENETTQFVKYENGRWYRFRVRVTDQMIRCSIDDKEIAAVKYTDYEVGTRIETRASEPLGFATWESTGAVRKIEMRKLTPAEVAATNRRDE